MKAEMITSASSFEVLGENIWHSSGPLKLAGMELGHRMTVVRLVSGALWVHSPVELDTETEAALNELGPVAHLVAPNKFHDLYWPAYVAAYPQAHFSCAPGFDRGAAGWDGGEELEGVAPQAWAGQIDQLVVRGMPRVNEVVFRHRESATLIVADLIFNLGTPGGFNGVMLRLAGAHGHAGPSRLFRAMVKDRQALRASLESILSWDFERLVMGHGGVIEKGGRQILEKAYAFLGTA
jgi:hypothetical protein